MRQISVLSLTILSGCATNFEPQPLPPDHPASVQAQEAPRTGMKRLVASDELTRKTKAQLARSDVPNPDFEGGGMSHDMSKMGGMDHSQMKGMEGMDHSKMPGMDMSKPSAGAPSPKPETMPGMDHSQMKDMTAPAPAAAAPDKEAVEMEMKKTSDEMKKTSDELKKKSDEAKSAKSSPVPAIYTCVMHPEVEQATPGNCPKCGMTLVKKEKAAR